MPADRGRDYGHRVQHAAAPTPAIPARRQPRSRLAGTSTGGTRNGLQVQCNREKPCTASTLAAGVHRVSTDPAVRLDFRLDSGPPAPFGVCLRGVARAHQSPENFPDRGTRHAFWGDSLMPRPASAIRDPHARLEAALLADGGLDPAVCKHLVSVARQDRREALGTPVLHRCARVTVLRLYARTLAADPDTMTLTRVTGEVIRGLRSLGMLKVGRSVVPPSRPGKEIFTAPKPPRPSRRRKPGRWLDLPEPVDDEDLDEGDDDDAA